MTPNKLNIAALIIGCASILLATTTHSKSLSYIGWIVAIIVIVSVFIGDLRESFKFVNKQTHREVGSKDLQIDQLSIDWELVILTLENCKIKESSDNQRLRFISLERIYKGITYDYTSPPTKYSVAYIRLLMDSTQSFKLYIDKSNPKNYHFEVPFS